MANCALEEFLGVSDLIHLIALFDIVEYSEQLIKQWKHTPPSWTTWPQEAAHVEVALYLFRHHVQTTFVPWFYQQMTQLQVRWKNPHIYWHRRNDTCYVTVLQDVWGLLPVTLSNIATLLRCWTEHPTCIITLDIPESTENVLTPQSFQCPCIIVTPRHLSWHDLRLLNPLPV